MSNYPNMSYCMCNNTLMALDQILDEMDKKGDVDFVRDLSQDELRDFNELAFIAKMFAKRAEKAADQLIDERVEEVLGE